MIGKARSVARLRVAELKKLHGDALGTLFTDAFVHAAEHAAVNELDTRDKWRRFIRLVARRRQRRGDLLTLSLPSYRQASLTLTRSMPTRSYARLWPTL